MSEANDRTLAEADVDAEISEELTETVNEAADATPSEEEAPAAPAAPAPAKRQRRPRPSEAARAWLEREALKRQRKSLVVATPAEAIETWGRVQGGGGIAPSAIPTLPGDRPEKRGHTIPVQVWLWVRSTPGYDAWRAGGSQTIFEAEISKRWSLPKTFFSPLPPLCDAELEEIARGRTEIERDLDREERGDAEGRLRPGMTKLP